MIKSYYIIAARQLELITEDSGYGLVDDSIITPSGDKIAVSDQIKTRAKYLADLTNIRATRDAIISSIDWVGNVDVPNSDLVTKLRTYRQELRDITEQIVEGQPLYVTWPIDPRSAETRPVIQQDT
jgi:hypothetical protein